ncbi:MAG: class I SAM-dependent rRNA methyltransferase [Pirellula sp.]|nr:class I SAM-dependent rRNA methyltransferase [Pirellula sp.]
MNDLSAKTSIQLHPSRKKHRLGRHPWILASSIVEPKDPPKLGDLVDLLHTDGRWIGRGLYNPHSRIRIRMLSWDASEAIDEQWLNTRLDRAFDLRQTMPGGSNLDAVRLIFSEADFLGGLIVDRFGPHIVIQVTAAAVLPWLDQVTQRLRERYSPESIALVIDDRTAKSEGIEPQSRVLEGCLPDAPFEIRENDLRWTIDLREGQKTGYYLDQRDNRRAAAAWTPLGARVLDICTYAGGFALTIARHAQPSQIIAVDSSAKALEWARGNAERNGLQNGNGLQDGIEWEQADFYNALSRRLESRDQFDMIVLDPPRLAGSRDQVDRALAAYHRLNYLACRILKPGGILVTCSCSGRVTRGDFLDMLHGVAVRVRRDLQILENRGASPDHPTSIHCPETDYLKCIIARVL